MIAKIGKLRARGKGWSFRYASFDVIEDQSEWKYPAHR